MVVRVIDLETNSLSPKDGGEVMEIASVDITKDFGITNQMQTFVNIEGEVSAKISSITHIIKSDLAGAPSFDEAIKQFTVGENLVMVSHNAKFDRQWLPMFDDRQWICTLKAARKLWTMADGYSNQSLRYALKLYEPFGIARHEIEPHRALSDAIVTAAILAHILKEKRATFRQLVDWSAAATEFA
jgi:exodeoxyribonuclease X